MIVIKVSLSIIVIFNNEKMDYISSNMKEDKTLK